MLFTWAESLQLHYPTHLFSLLILPHCDLFEEYNKYLPLDKTACSHYLIN